jgi:hypothetical protein
MQGFDHWYGIHNTSLPVDPNFPGTDMEIIESQKVMEGKAGKPAKVVRDMDIEYRPLIDRDLTKMSIDIRSYLNNPKSNVICAYSKILC